MPDTATVLAPLLNVRRGREAIAFYQAALGAEVAFSVADPGGNVVAKLTLPTGGEFWLADEAPAHGNPAPETLGGTTLRVVVNTPDPDAAFARAVAAGATPVSPVADRPYGWRDGRVADPFGHHWEFGRPLVSH